MSVQSLKIVVAPHEQTSSLSELLQKHFPIAFGRSFTSADVRKLIRAGGVHLNRKRVIDPAAKIKRGDRLDCYCDPSKLGDPQVTVKITRKNILFEDDYLLVVNKPFGLPTQPTLDGHRDNLYFQLMALQKEKWGESAYVGLHHRLDKETSGVVLFTKQREVNKAIGDAFKNRLIEKTYEAIAQRRSLLGKSPAIPSPKSAKTELEVRSYIAKGKEKRGKRVLYQSVRSGGDLAITQFKILKDHGHTIWLRCWPLTGRTHQIRIHCADQGFPIVGDTLYGEINPKYRLLLHAASLSFEHPVTQKRIRIECDLPVEFQEFFRSK